MTQRILKDYQFMKNREGKLMLALGTLGGMPEQPRIYYDGGANAIFCKRPNEVFLLADIAPEIRHYLAFANNITIEETGGESYPAQCFFSSDIPALRGIHQEPAA